MKNKNVFLLPIAVLAVVFVVALAGCPPVDPDKDVGLPDGSTNTDSGIADGSVDSGHPGPDGGVVPDGSVEDAGPGDTGSGPDDAGLSDTGLNDAGEGDTGTADSGSMDGGVEKISKFGMVGISYMESASHAQGILSGQFFGMYKPGKSKGGGGGWVGPELDECVLIPPSEPCNPPDCTPAEIEYVDLGDVVLTGFLSGPVTFSGGQTSMSIEASEFLFESDYTVEGVGTGFGPFSATLTMPPRLKLLKPDTCFVDQSEAMEITWEGSGIKPVWITFQVSDTSMKPYALFCQATNDGAFTIPSDVMEKLPTEVQSQYLSISNSASAQLVIPGMDTGSFTASIITYMSCY